MLGGFPKDTFDGEFSELCEKTFHKSKSFITIDISGSMAYLMCPKDEPEINNIRKAALVSMELFNKYLKDQIMEIVDSDKVSHNFNSNILLYKSYTVISKSQNEYQISITLSDLF